MGPGIFDGVEGLGGAGVFEGEFFFDVFPATSRLQLNAEAIGHSNHVGIEDDDVDHVDNVLVTPAVASEFVVVGGGDVCGIQGEVLGELQHGDLLLCQTGVSIVQAHLLCQLRIGFRSTQSLCVGDGSIAALVEG